MVNVYVYSPGDRNMLVTVIKTTIWEQFFCRISLILTLRSAIDFDLI